MTSGIFQVISRKDSSSNVGKLAPPGLRSVAQEASAYPCFAMPSRPSGTRPECVREALRIHAVIISLRLHTGKTNAFLWGRIKGQNLRNASTFSDLPMARGALRAAVDANRGKINSWLSSEAPAALMIRFTAPIPIGRVMNDRGQVRDGYTAVFLLLPYRTDDGGDFSVLTGYVE